MTPNLEYMTPNSTLLDAANIMKEKRIHRLLILPEDGAGTSQRKEISKI